MNVLLTVTTILYHYGTMNVLLTVATILYHYGTMNVLLTVATIFDHHGAMRATSDISLSKAYSSKPVVGTFVNLRCTPKSDVASATDVATTSPLRVT